MVLPFQRRRPWLHKGEHDGAGGDRGQSASRVHQGTQLSPVGHSSLSQNMNKKKININKEGKENVSSYFAKKQHLQFMNYAESVQITGESCIIKYIN